MLESFMSEANAEEVEEAEAEGRKTISARRGCNESMQHQSLKEILAAMRFPDVCRCRRNYVPTIGLASK